MRKVPALLLLASLLVHAVVPALPAYACAGMGVRLPRPCCPPDEEDPEEMPAGAAVGDPCCTPAPPVAKAGVGLPPQPPAPAPVLLVATLPDPPWPRPALAHPAPPLPRAGAPPRAPATMRTILRI